MAKKFLLGLLMAAMVGGAAFAQENAETPKNWVSGELSILGGGVRYERTLSPKLSVGANAYFSTLIVFSEIDASAFVRFYPWDGKFFVEGAVGYNYHLVLTGLTNWSTSGVAISPGLGWKIDVGKKGGFFVQPGVKVPITLGTVSIDSVWDDVEVEGHKNGDFNVAFGVVPYCGMGWAF